MNVINKSCGANESWTLLKVPFLFAISLSSFITYACWAKDASDKATPENVNESKAKAGIYSIYKSDVLNGFITGETVTKTPEEPNISKDPTKPTK